MDFELVVARGKASSRNIKLKGPRVVLGRASDCDLRITSQKVSRKHCEIVEQDDGLLAVRDLGSSNGTYINNEKVSEERTVHAGDELAIGPVRFVIQYPEGGGAEAKTGGPTARQETPVEVDAFKGGEDEDLIDVLDLKIDDEEPSPRQKSPAAAPKVASASDTKSDAEPSPAPAKAKKKPAEKPKAAGKKAAPVESDEDLAAMFLGLDTDSEDDEDSTDRPTENFKFDLNG